MECFDCGRSTSVSEQFVSDFWRESNVKPEDVMNTYVANRKLVTIEEGTHV